MTRADALAQCDFELSQIEAELRAGHPDAEGLCRAMLDQTTERWLILQEAAMTAPAGMEFARREGGIAGVLERFSLYSERGIVYTGDVGLVCKPALLQFSLVAGRPPLLEPALSRLNSPSRSGQA